MPRETPLKFTKMKCIIIDCCTSCINFQKTDNETGRWITKGSKPNACYRND